MFKETFEETLIRLYGEGEDNPTLKKTMSDGFIPTNRWFSASGQPIYMPFAAVFWSAPSRSEVQEAREIRERLAREKNENE